jgi:hypothetical protein
VHTSSVEHEVNRYRYVHFTDIGRLAQEEDDFSPGAQGNQVASSWLTIVGSNFADSIAFSGLFCVKLKGGFNRNNLHFLLFYCIKKIAVGTWPFFWIIIVNCH